MPHFNKVGVFISQERGGGRGGGAQGFNLIVIGNPLVKEIWTRHPSLLPFTMCMYVRTEDSKQSIVKIIR